MVSIVPVSITLKNIPDAVYERLKVSAELNRRSLNSEAIVCLESVLMGTQSSVEERVARARALRATLPQGAFTAKGIDQLKRAGRR